MTDFGEWVTDTWEGAREQAGALQGSIDDALQSAQAQAQARARAAANRAYETTVGEAQRGAAWAYDATVGEARRGVNSLEDQIGGAFRAARETATETVQTANNTLRWILIGVAVVAVIGLALLALYLYGLFKVTSKALDVLPDVAKPLGEGLAIGAKV